MKELSNAISLTNECDRGNNEDNLKNFNKLSHLRICLNHCIKFYFRFRLIGFILTLVLYSVLGGLLFSNLESQHEIDTNIKKVEALNKDAKNLTVMIFLVLENHRNSKEQKFDEIRILINEYQRSEGLYPKDDLMWSFVGGIFFSSTVFTTIGYGNIHPNTTKGRVAVMIYAFFGIPYTLFVVSEIGKFLTILLNIFWLKVLRLLTASGLRKFSFRDKNSTIVDEDVKFPVLLAIFIAFLWNFICAGLFCIWEKSWSYFDAFYFFFISLSTIGFGDVMPEHIEYMVFNPFVIIGICLVCIVAHLMQSKLESFKKKTSIYVEHFVSMDSMEEKVELEGE